MGIDGMSLRLDKSNKERLDLLIGFLENDKMAEDMGNVEKAAANFLRNNAELVIGIADYFDGEGKLAVS
jgi:hypothetical protein